MKRRNVSIILTAVLLACVLQVSARKNNHRNGPQTIEAAEVVDNFRQHVEDLPYLSETTVQALKDEIAAHIEKLHNWKDREAYAQENDLQGFLAREREELQKQKDGVNDMLDEFMMQYDGNVVDDSAGCRDSLQRIVSDKLGLLETNLNLLEREMNANDEDGSGLPWLLVGGIAGGVVLLLLIWALVSSHKKKKPVPVPVVPPTSDNGTGNSKSGEPAIIVRRKTATILKKQSLEDVMDNSHYMKVDLEDCCFESAVRRMYIKDSCVVEVYNMYAQSLLNPAGAKEYGCMVLGRWVYDAENNEYYVSLEQVVLPGDDAIFEEYELNFGGKIKLKVLEQLRKLRRETNLQYDLTCWIHSHPGLTVFFSNADSNVQDQLKHPQHPKFLTALVVDTLTPTMETGIFTYHRDMTLNTKNDLKKLYSLKEWYQWAQQSIKDETPATLPSSAKAEETANFADAQTSDLFDTLAEAKEHTTACFSINLNKDIVVDLCMALSGQVNGVAGIVHGQIVKKDLTEYVAERLSSNDKEDSLQQLGCFVVTQHFSIPTVRKAVADKLEKLKFVLVYTIADGELTSVPVMGGDLCVDDSYYGKQRLEDLKLWTKKGR